MEQVVPIGVQQTVDSKACKGCFAARCVLRLESIILTLQLNEFQNDTKMGRIQRSDNFFRARGMNKVFALVLFLKIKANQQISFSYRRISVP